MHVEGKDNFQRELKQANSLKEALCRPLNANIKALTVVHSFINKVILGSLLSQKSSPRSGQKNIHSKMIMAKVVG